VDGDGAVLEAAGRVVEAEAGFVAFTEGRASALIVFPGAASVGFAGVACSSARRFTRGLSVMGAAKSNSAGAASALGLVEGTSFSGMTH
jgi:hypothetical protein